VHLYPFLIVSILLGAGCAKGLAEPVRPTETKKVVVAEDAHEETDDGLKPVKYPQIEACFVRYATPNWREGEEFRDYVLSVKLTEDPLDMRLAPPDDLEIEALKACLLAAVRQIRPDTILFATAARLHKNRAPTAIPMIQGALTPLQVREGIMGNKFGQCMTQKQYSVRLHGAAILKGEIVNGVLLAPRVYASTLQDPEYESCLQEKMNELRFEALPESSTLNFPYSVRVSDLDP